jgi:hypothetical protein
LITKRKMQELLLRADADGWKEGRDAGFSSGYGKGYADGKARALVADESYAAGRDEGMKTGEGLLGEILKAAFADHIRVRYAFEAARDPIDRGQVSYKKFLAGCAESATMTEDTARAKLAEMGVTL